MASVLQRYRRPEYTGGNRCLPCTVVNLVIAACVTVVAVVATRELLTPDIAVVTGAVVAGLSLLAIYVRGYLVPGTPALTARYLPNRVLTAFGKDEPVETATSDGVDAEAMLIAAGALAESPDGSDLELTDEFRTVWYEKMEDDSAREGLLARLGIDADNVTTSSQGNGFRTFADGNYVGTWESPESFDADAAATAVLADRWSRWTTLSTGERSQVLSGLRLFLDRCPSCGGQTRFGSEAVDSCCTNQEAVTVTCEDCGARLFETPAETTAGEV